MSLAVNGVKSPARPPRTGPIMTPLRRTKEPGGRVALALAVPTVTPGKNVSGVKLNDYADARRTSLGFTVPRGAAADATSAAAWAGTTRPEAGRHCTPPGLIVTGDNRACGKALCRFCWARAVENLLNALHARREACEAAGLPFEAMLVRQDFPLTRGHRDLELRAVQDWRKRNKRLVDSPKGGTPAGGWVAFMVVPHPPGLSPRPPSKVGGDPSDEVLSLFAARAFEGPAVRDLSPSDPGRRELAIPGGCLDDCLKPKGGLVEFFAPAHDPAAVSAGDSRAVRDFLAKKKRVTAYGTLRPKRAGEAITENPKGGSCETGAADTPAGPGATPAARPSRRPPPMAPLPTRATPAWR